MTKENFDRMVAIKENFKEILSKNLESYNSYS